MKVEGSSWTKLAAPREEQRGDDGAGGEQDGQECERGDVAVHGGVLQAGVRPVLGQIGRGGRGGDGIEQGGPQ